jgi:endonuclease YncB( thermonuclease family)
LSAFRSSILRAATLILLCCSGASCNAQQPDVQVGVDPGSVIGTYSDFRVIDGDTFRIEGLERGIRFLFIDTEEVPRGDRARAELAQLRETWPQPYFDRRGDKRFPVKMASPFGWESSEWAKKWFSDVDSIRLERDSDANIYGYFGRWLALVFARKAGKWVLYNLECVRMGHSPYYGKYGFSERFHDAFRAAEQEARTAGRGIWNPSLLHYPDYDERLAWWNGRGEDIARYLAVCAARENCFFLGRDGEFERLSLSAGNTVTVFGMVDWIGDERPVQALRLPHKEKTAVVVELPGSADEEWLLSLEQQYVYVRGRIRGSGRELRLELESFDRVSRRPFD